MTQKTFFGEPDTSEQVAKLNARRKQKAEPGPPPAEQAAKDKAVVLRELQRGPTTNHALNALCMSYRQRISDLRKDGHKITNRKLAGRVSLYELE